MEEKIVEEEKEEIEPEEVSEEEKVEEVSEEEVVEEEEPKEVKEEKVEEEVEKPEVTEEKEEERRGFERRMYKATCADCGRECEVPFKPIEGRKIYCRDCYRKHRPMRRRRRF